MTTFAEKGLLGAVMGCVWTEPMLVRGMPEGTRGVVHEDDRGTVYAQLSTGNCITWGSRRSRPYRSVDDVMRELDSMVQDTVDRHWLATFNVWPGWRI